MQQQCDSLAFEFRNQQFLPICARKWLVLTRQKDKDDIRMTYLLPRLQAFVRVFDLATAGVVIIFIASAWWQTI